MQRELRAVAFVCPRWPGEGMVGGAETLLRSLAERAAARGMKVVYLTTCARNHFTWANEVPAGREVIRGVEVQRFPVDEDRDVGLFLRLQEAICTGARLEPEEEAAWSENSVNSRSLCEHLRAHAGDYDRIVAGPYLFGLTMAVSRVCPGSTLLVPCLHEEPFAHLGVIREMFLAVRGVLFNSEPEQALAQRITGIPSSRGAVVGMGLDSFTADRTVFSDRHGLRAPYVLYAGRREEAKGVPLLLEYLEAFQGRTGIDLNVVLAGHGVVAPPAGLRARVLDVGVLSEEEKREAMAGARVFLHPSRLESLGIVLLESFLAGTPALVHEGSAVLRWQCERSGGGLWFRGYPDFEEELRLLWNDPDLRHRMGEQGRAYVQREYGWAAIEAKFMAALATL